MWTIYEDVRAVAPKPAAKGQDHKNILKRLRPEVNFKFWVHRNPSTGSSFTASERIKFFGQNQNFLRGSFLLSKGKKSNLAFQGTMNIFWIFGTFIDQFMNKQTWLIHQEKRVTGASVQELSCPEKFFYWKIFCTLEFYVKTWCCIFCNNKNFWCD